VYIAICSVLCFVLLKRTSDFKLRVRCLSLLDMGQMTDYDTWPKPKLWAGSVHSPVEDAVSSSIQHSAEVQLNVRHSFA